MQKNMLELKNQENLYKENQKSIQELNKWKHDIKHILNTIRHNINNNNLNEAKHIIDKYNNILVCISSFLSCSFLFSRKIRHKKKDNKFTHIQIVIIY